MHFQISLSFVLVLHIVAGHQLASRQVCSENYQICSPAGAKVDTLGPIGVGWDNIYSDIVNLVWKYSLNNANPDTTTLNPDGPARRDTVFCCSDVADCLLLNTVEIAMCWDKFTTNVYFPDGTYGSVTRGDFNTSAGDQIDLLYGDYTLMNGKKGNIYNDNGVSSAQPNTATLSMPEPFTSSGEGSAIPATGLGTTESLSTVTTVMPATTDAATTHDSITLIATMTGCNNCPPYNTTIAGPTEMGTTHLASTSVFTTGIITPTMVGNYAEKAVCNLKIYIFVTMASVLALMI